MIRPAAVWVSTALNDFTARERALLGWAGLRGAVPIVLGTFVLSSEVGHAETIFSAVFVVVVSALLHGTTLEVAERLGVVSPPREHVPPPLEVDALGSLELVEFEVRANHAVAGSAVREARPATIRARRGRGTWGETIPPRGSTVLQAGDRLFVLAPRSIRADLEDVFERWRRRV